MQILYSRPPLHCHEYDFILVRSGSFQKAGRRDVAFTRGYRDKPSEPVQNRFKIRMVRKSEPEIGPVHKRTIPFPYEEKAGPVQVHFPDLLGFYGYTQVHFTYSSQYIRETLFSCRSACVFFIFRHKLLNFNLSGPPNSFFEIILPMFFLKFL